MTIDGSADFVDADERSRAAGRERVMNDEYEKCFVYQCLAYKCHGASLESEKFMNVCLKCPAFRNWIKERERRE